MKKKIAMILTAMLMVVFALTACGSGSKADPNEGNWEATKIAAGGLEVDLAEFEKTMGQEMNISINFKADGTLTADAMGETSDGEWKAKDGGKYDVTMDGQTEEVTLADGKLTLEIEGAACIFEKK